MSIHLLTRINLTPAKAEPDRATVVADNLLKARKSTNIALIGLFAAIDAILLGFFLSKLDGKDDLPLQLLMQRQEQPLCLMILSKS